jgi:ribonuclease HII
VCGWALENAARRRGALCVAGLDEVGRGPMFGPVVAAAVIFPERIQNNSRKNRGTNLTR